MNLTLHGRVLPEAVKFTLGVFEITVALGDSEPHLDLTFDMKAKIESGILLVDCAVRDKSMTDRDITTSFILARVRKIIQTALDVCAVGSGLALIAWFDTYQIDNGDKTFLKLGVPALKLPAIPDNDSANRWIQAAFYNRQLGHVFADLNMCLTMPEYQAISCGRALDGMRHIVAGEDATSDRGWRLLRQALNVDRSYLQLISNVSKNPRHGGRHRANPAMEREAVVRSWNLLNRLLVFIERGRVNLTAPEYELLLE